MIMKNRQAAAHMRAAEEYAKLSYAKRLKVGALIVKGDRVISIGINGTPAGWDNNCEVVTREAIEVDGQILSPEITVTKPEVIHAEANAIAKLARCNESGEGSIMFVTHAPCLECAKLIFTAGIKQVYYQDNYRKEDGLAFLNKCGVITTNIKYQYNCDRY